MREPTALFAAEDGAAIGAITSGGFGPEPRRAGGQVAVPIELAAPGTRLFGRLRAKMLPATVTKMPFITLATNVERRRDECCDSLRSTSG